MRETDLPSPGRFNYAYQVRRVIVNAISSMQVSKRPNGKHPAAAPFKVFLQAAIAAVEPLIILAPTVTTAPAISGTAKVGSTLTVTPGVFTNDPIVTRQWQKGTANIPGATGLTYVPVAGDVGSTIRVVTTAKNEAGQVISNSTATVAVVA